MSFACVSAADAYIEVLNPERYPRYVMTYVDAACAPLRKTGQIKVHGHEAFAGMRKAGRLAAECLDILVGEINPGVTTEQIDRRVFELVGGELVEFQR